MKQNLEKIIGYRLASSDEEIGKVKEVYFEDDTWSIRYLIIETAGLFSGRKVLISPHSVLNVDDNREALIVNLTSEQIKNSPEIDTEKPVYRQQEIELSRHYGWPNYWAGGLWGAGIGTTGMMLGNRLPLKEAIEGEQYLENDQEESNAHLRSSEKIKGYKIEARGGGEVAEVSDYVIDVIDWRIYFLIGDTGKWFQAKKILIPSTRIIEIRWDSSAVIVDSSVESIKGSPAYSGERITEAYTAALEKYYEQADSGGTG